MISKCISVAVFWISAMMIYPFLLVGRAILLGYEMASDMEESLH